MIFSHFYFHFATIFLGMIWRLDFCLSKIWKDAFDNRVRRNGINLNPEFWSQNHSIGRPIDRLENFWRPGDVWLSCLAKRSSSKFGGFLNWKLFRLLLGRTRWNFRTIWNVWNIWQLGDFWQVRKFCLDGFLDWQLYLHFCWVLLRWTGWMSRTTWSVWPRRNLWQDRRSSEGIEIWRKRKNQTRRKWVVGSSFCFSIMSECEHSLIWFSFTGRLIFKLFRPLFWLLKLLLPLLFLKLRFRLCCCLLLLLLKLMWNRTCWRFTWFVQLKAVLLGW